MNGEQQLSTIENVLYVPDIRKNLFLVGVCIFRSFSVMFQGQNVSIAIQRAVVAQGVKQENGVFRMVFKVTEMVAVPRCKSLYSKPESLAG